MLNKLFLNFKIKTIKYLFFKGGNLFIFNFIFDKLKIKDKI